MQNLIDSLGSNYQTRVYSYKWEKQFCLEICLRLHEILRNNTRIKYSLQLNTVKLDIFRLCLIVACVNVIAKINADILYSTPMHVELYYCNWTWNMYTVSWAWGYVAEVNASTLNSYLYAQPLLWICNEERAFLPWPN